MLGLLIVVPIGTNIEHRVEVMLPIGDFIHKIEAKVDFYFPC